MDNKRKKIFFGAESGGFRYIMEDAVLDQSYEFCSFGEKHRSRIKNLLISKKTMRLLPNCIKTIVYRKIFNFSFLYRKEFEKEYIFLFSNGFELFSERESFLAFVDYLKSNYKKSKTALHLYEAMYTKEAKEFVAKCKKRFDVILTFNRYDADEQAIEYYGPVSECGAVKPQGEGEDSDAFFVGGAGRTRYPLIVDTFKWLSDHGKKCIFYISIPIELKKPYFQQLCRALQIELPFQEECCIEYRQSKFYFGRYISYAWNLPYLIRTKVMLEMINLPDGVASSTNRLAQAMAYHKKLLTTSKITEQESYYNKNNISTFSTPEEIDLAFFNTDFQDTGKDFSTVCLLKYMEKKAFGNVL